MPNPIVFTPTQLMFFCTPPLPPNDPFGGAVPDGQFIQSTTLPFEQSIFTATLGGQNPDQFDLSLTPFNPVFGFPPPKPVPSPDLATPLKGPQGVPLRAPVVVGYVMGTSSPRGPVPVPKDGFLQIFVTAKPLSETAQNFAKLTTQGTNRATADMVVEGTNLDSTSTHIGLILNVVRVDPTQPPLISATPSHSATALPTIAAGFAGQLIQCTTAFNLWPPDQAPRCPTVLLNFRQLLLEVDK
jgi:hypothetical protein